MRSDPPNRSLLFALAGALGLCLLVIAFLLGRLSSEAPDTSATAAPAAPENRARAPEVGEDVPAPTPTENPEHRWAEWEDSEGWDPSGPAPQVDQEDEARIERQPDGRILLSNRNLDGTSHVPSSTPAYPQPTAATSAVPGSTKGNGANIASYFQRVDAVRSSSSAADPNAFAMDLIKATMKGSTEGFDELIEDTKRMRNELAAIEPPPECIAYQRESLSALDDSQAILDAMKNAILNGDMGALTQITQRAGALQAKADTLETLRRQTLENARR